MKTPFAPYIGVTGFTALTEVAYVLDGIPSQAKRELMVGVLVSSKTLQGIPARHPKRYPPLEVVWRIFPTDPHCLNLIHFSTKDPTTLEDQVDRVLKAVGPGCHGFQFNMCWPRPDTLQRIRPRMGRLVLQVGGHALEWVRHAPHQLVAKLSEYQGIATDILLDPSGGTGRPFDQEEILEYLRAITHADLGFGIGVAGGLSSESLGSIATISKEFPTLSINAEGRLRSPDDDLDPLRARAYVQGAYRIFGD